VVEKTFHRLAISKMRADNFWGILSPNTGVKNALRFNNHAGTLLAKSMTVAAADFHHGILQPLPSNLYLERLIDSVRPHRKTWRLLTDEDRAMVLHTTLHLFGS
jgi:hypothetical protein